MASKRLGPLPRIKRGALGRGCGREGRGALPLPRAAVISTRLRIPTHALFPVSTAPSATPIPSYTPASALLRVRVRVSSL